MDDYLTIDEAAETLQRSKPTLWRLIAKYGIQTYRRPMDRRTYVKSSDLERIRATFLPRERAAS